MWLMLWLFFFFQAEDGIRDLVRSRGLGDVYKRQGLGSARSAILSAVIFNALIIVALIPLALRGVQFRAVGAAEVLRRNIAIYGLGGLIAPFIGIKAIDLIITTLGVS